MTPVRHCASHERRAIAGRDRPCDIRRLRFHPDWQRDRRGLHSKSSHWLPEPERETADIRCAVRTRSEEHTSELQSLMRISYAVFCSKKKKEQRRHAGNSNSPEMNTQYNNMRDLYRSTIN